MRHSVYLKLKTQFIYTLLFLTAHTRSESDPDFSFKHDIPGLECISQKVKGSFHLLVRSLSFMTVLAVDYFRLASIYFELALFQSLLNRFKSLLSFNKAVAVNNDIICVPLKFAFRIFSADTTCQKQNAGKCSQVMDLSLRLAVCLFHHSL